MLERLQKIIARAGIASRRRAEDLIVAGEVKVNGKVVTELGTKADPEKDSIRVAGRLLRPSERKIFLALNKPDSCVSTLSDPGGRATLRDYLSGVAGRVFPVGRLEYHSTGLILLIRMAFETRRTLPTLQASPTRRTLPARQTLPAARIR